LAAGSAEFAEQKVRSICVRLPEFTRLTTLDGAPSDFVVRAEDGSVEFNLMHPGVLGQMAQYIESLYDNDVDRVLGALYFSYHPAIGRHMSMGHRYNKGCGPLSIMRLNFAGGGGNCGFHSRLFTGVASHLTIGGERLTAHTVGVWGHCIAAVGWRGSKSLIDADVGHFFLTADGTDLITIDEMRRGDPVITTAGPGELGRYLTFADEHTREYPTTVIDTFTGVFPPGAPPE